MPDAKFRLNNLLSNQSVSNADYSSLPDIGDSEGDIDNILQDDAPPKSKIQPSTKSVKPSPAPISDIDRPNLARKIRMAKSSPILSKKLRNAGVHIGDLNSMSDVELQNLYDDVNTTIHASHSNTVISYGLKLLPTAWETGFNILRPNGMTITGFAKIMEANEDFAECVELLAWKYSRGENMGAEMRLALLFLKTTMTCNAQNKAMLGDDGKVPDKYAGLLNKKTPTKGASSPFVEGNAQ